ncbi:hypothetical protein GQ53DRAFT_755654 [Thozetella sp. PMI_491]|nr:hypothetical protein GQ53DRAFT_755654 [Thozetella sp. PMI_491]
MDDQVIQHAPADRAAATEWARDQMADALQLLATFQISENIEDLDRAIALARTVAKDARSAPSGTVAAKARPACLNILGVLLNKRFTARQDVSSLEDSVECVREAVESFTDEDVEERSYYFFNLQAALTNRYKQTNETGHLVEAIDTAQRLTDRSAAGSADHVMSLDLLRVLCTLGFESTSDPTYLDRAIQAGESLIKHGTATSKLWLTTLNEIEWLLHHKYDITGDMVHLDRAVQLSRLGVASITTWNSSPEAQVYRPSSLHNLVFSLLQRFQATNQDEDLLAAVDAHRKALAESSGPEHAEFRSLLWADLHAICKAVYVHRASFELLINDIMLDAVRIIESGDGPSYRLLLCGPGDVPRPDQESAEYMAQREAAATWLSGIAGRFELCFQRTGTTDDIELAVTMTFQALQLAGPLHPHWGKMETGQRSRWRMWSDHVGKIPDSEIKILAIGDGGTWIPPEMLAAGTGQDLELETDAFVMVGKMDQHHDPNTLLTLNSDTSSLQQKIA